jgi:arylsulfatase A-like enzyme
MLRRLLDSPWFYFAGAGLLLIVAIASQFKLQVPSRPKGTVEDIAALSQRDDLNIIFVLVDTLRSDRLGIYGYERATSPVLDDLGAHGIVFNRVIAQSSWTKSSMASLWTATNPTKNGILRYNHTLPQEVDFPAEIFKRAGFRTAGIWRNGWVAPNFGFDQGFDTYVKPMSSPERRRVQRGNPSARKLKGTDLDITDSAVEFLRNFGKDRFFLYLHFMDIHQYATTTRPLRLETATPTPTTSPSTGRIGSSQRSSAKSMRSIC